MSKPAHPFTAHRTRPNIVRVSITFPAALAPDLGTAFDRVCAAHPHVTRAEVARMVFRAGLAHLDREAKE